MDGAAPTFTIRSFRPADLSACRKLYVEGLVGGTLAGNDTGFDLDDIDSTYIKSPGSHFWVATVPAGEESGTSSGTAGTEGAAGDVVVGMIGVQHHDAGIGEVRRLRVDAEHRRRGIGSALVEQALHFCRDQHYLKITLDTFVDREPAIHLFEKFGFRHHHTRNIAGRDLLYFYLDLYKQDGRRENTP
jgi:ribosomal protein S18 acetylase RimI-like enzyme